MTKENLKAKEKHLTHKEKTFIELILRNYARRNWVKQLNCVEKKLPQTQNWHLQNSPSKRQRNKEFLNKQKIEVICFQISGQETLKEVLQRQVKWYKPEIQIYPRKSEHQRTGKVIYKPLLFLLITNLTNKSLFKAMGTNVFYYAGLWTYLHVFILLL